MAEHYACTAERFAQDVAQHAMTIDRDDGVSRHVRFKRAGDHAYWFDLVTWPGVLVIHGDMGTYVFSRVNDMFKFFRDDGGGINPYYWAEKLQGEYRGRPSRGMEFSEALFRAAVKRDFRERWRGRCRSAEDFEQRRECWGQVRCEVIGAACDGEHAAVRAAMDFTYDMPRGSSVFPGGTFGFVDFYEHNFHEYTFGFIWCCRAIVWGIRQYDERPMAVPESASESKDG